MACPLNQMSITNNIQNWFKEEWGGSLLLPDGWHGRPHDNQHALTSVNEAGGAVTVILDAKLTLRFEGLKSVEARKGELVLGPFDRLLFDWETYDANPRHSSKEYRSGEVKIVCAPGAR
jgi:hypothetical protein